MSDNPQSGHNLWDTPMFTRNAGATHDKSLRCASSQPAATRNRSQRSAHRLGKRFAVFAALAVGVLTSNTSEAQVHWKDHPMNLKLYASKMIDDWDELVCFVELIHRESTWNPKAKNGSHFGLGQMRSRWYGQQTARKQIRLTLTYITKRYDGRICDGALAHSLAKGWY